MKWILMRFFLCLSIVLCQVVFASTGLFFNVQISGTTLSISTTKPNHIYPDAGIKISTPGYSIQAGCMPNVNGYCLFSTSSAAPSSLSINGPSGNVDIILCLNGAGPLSCQTYSVVVAASPPKPAFAYVSNSGNSTVSLCGFNPDNITFNNCSSTGSGFVSPTGIAFNPAATYSYIGNSASTINICSVNQDGTFGSCNQYFNSYSDPTGIVINSANTIAYINDTDGETWVCPINPNGTLGACNCTACSFGTPEGLALNPSNTIAYVVDNFFSKVYYCNINSIDGTLISCNVTGNGFIKPFGIALNPKNTYAYITNNTNNTVSYCSILGDGSLTSCQITGSGFNSPTFLTINAAGTVAYITNSGNNTVSYCDINADGSFNTCNVTGSGFSVPQGIALTAA